MIRDPIEEAGEPPAPCELDYTNRASAHPRYPSGFCNVCGARPEESCKYYEEQSNDGTLR